MAVHIHEFLYRGREGSAEPPAWHLTLASTGENDFGEPVRSERTLNMTQAADAGWDLPDIIAAINADALVEIEGKRSEIHDLQGQLADAIERKVGAERTADALRLELDSAEVTQGADQPQAG